MARWILSCGILSLLALSAVGHPAYVPVDPAAALVQADPGRTTFTLAADSDGWSATLSRSVSRACDIVAAIGSCSAPALRVRALVLPSLFPLRLAVELGSDRLVVLGALHLGPLEVVGDRTWGDAAGVRIAVHAADPRCVASVGMELGGEAVPFVATTWFPRAAPLWGLSLVATAHGVRVAIGGTW